MKNFFVILLLIFNFFCLVSSADSVSGFGGNITQVNLTILQTVDRWQIFYGRINASAGNNITTSYNAPSDYLELPSTYSFYLISNSSSLEGDYLVPSLDEVDNYFDLIGSSSSHYLFNNLSNFTLYISNTPTTFLLPTLYLPGKNSDGSIDHFAFRSGIIKKGQNFVFVVPLSPSKALNDETYDFMFALPTKLDGINFHIFSTARHITQQGGVELFTLSLSWEYDGTILTIKSLPDTTILLYDERGALYSGKTNNDGIYSLNVFAGFKYYLTAKKSGYREANLILYIPKPIIVENINKTEEQLKITKSEEEREEGPFLIPGVQTMFIQGESGGISICFQGQDCYLTNFASKEEIEKLNELFCISSVCFLAGSSKTDFIKKYELKRIETKFFSPVTKQNIPFDYSSFFKNIGYELSKNLGTAKIFDPRFPNFFFYVFAFFSVLAIFFYIFFSKLINKREYRGHD